MDFLEEMVKLFDFIGRLVCHQRPERTLWIGGHCLPVCARDTGAFLGLLLGYSLLLFLRRKEAKGPPNLILTLAMLVPMLVDSFGQMFGFWTSTNDVRLVTGLLFGMALAPFLVYAISLASFGSKIPLAKAILVKNADVDDKHACLGVRELGVGILLSGVLFICIKLIVGSEFSLFYWVLSIPLIAVIISHILVLPSLLLVAILRK
jgi:uncharacterized membrane protein